MKLGSRFLWAGLLIVTALSALAAYGLLGERQRFVTWEGIGPDKWGTVWLIRRHVDPQAPIAFLPPKSPIEEGIAFDVPGSSLSRTATATAFEEVIKAYGVEYPAVLQLAPIIHDIEINGWQVRSFTGTAVVENAFRLLQQRHGREQVSFACYLEFFDQIAARLERGEDLAALEPQALFPHRDCALAGELPDAGQLLVPELAADDVLSRMARGDKVVFVDTREDGEYAEGHIPGAIGIKLREVDQSAAQRLADADLVVPYCVKDFRGFEVARALQRVGVDRVAIMNPYGIKGWRQLGLPVTGTLALSEAEARQALQVCLDDIATCVRTQ